MNDRHNPPHSASGSKSASAISDHEVNAAVTAALRAGAEIMQIYSREFSVEEKEDCSPLTEADTRAHTEIDAVLAAWTPSIPILSEEGVSIPAAERRRWPRYWLVDPLDGTKEFIKKNDEFTVNIALMATAAVQPQQAAAFGEQPVGTAQPAAGVVFVPATGMLYVGVVGKGSWSIKVEPDGTALAGPGAPAKPDLTHIAKHGTPLPAVLEYADRPGRMVAGSFLGLRPAVRPSTEQRGPRSGVATRPFTVVASRSHLSPETQAYVDTLRADHSDLQLLSAGSSIKICRVAEGSADEYPRFAPTMEWDTAAGDAVARAAGCEVLVWDANGGPTAGPAGDHTGGAVGSAGTAGTATGAPAGPLVYNKEDLHNPWFLVRRR